jgi:hypothetical protein
MAFIRVFSAVPLTRLSTPLVLALSIAQPALARGADPAEPSPSELPPQEEPSTGVAYSGSVSGLYGMLPDASDSLNPYGAGLGLRLGITLPVRLYFGVSYEHFFGGEPVSYANVVAWETEATVDQVQGWVGYQLPLDGVTLLPCLGIGAAYMQKETLVTDMRGEQERTEEDAVGLVVAPALQLVFPIGGPSLLVEGRYSIVPEDVAEADALSIGVGFGVEI